MPSSSPPLSLVGDVDNSELEAQLDAQILHIRREIAKLRSQKNQLSSALLGSSRVQKHVHDRKASRNGSDKLQERLDEAVETQRRENDVSIHRLAIGVTAFPFTDPAPERQGEPAMLGVRFDLAPTSFESTSARCSVVACAVDTRNTYAEDRETSTQEGHLENTYFVMLRRLDYQGRTYLKVHHHTIPGHINVEHYANRYLPLPEALEHNEDVGMNGVGHDNNSASEEIAPFEDDSGIDVTQDIQLDADVDMDSPHHHAGATETQPGTNLPSRTTASTPTADQNLHTFTARLRDDLQSWHNLSKSIAHIRHSLGLHPHHDNQTASNQNRGATPTTPPSTFDQHQYQSTATATIAAQHAIISLEQDTNDARQIIIVWADETLGKLRLSYDGSIDKAVLYGTKSQSSSTSASQPEPEPESELSELESDDDRNIIRTHKHHRKAQQTDERPVSHVRMHEVERLLTFDEDGAKVMVQDLLGRLRVVAERVFSEWA